MIIINIIFIMTSIGKDHHHHDNYDDDHGYLFFTAKSIGEVVPMPDWDVSVSVGKPRFYHLQCLPHLQCYCQGLPHLQHHRQRLTHLQCHRQHLTHLQCYCQSIIYFAQQPPLRLLKNKRSEDQYNIGTHHKDEKHVISIKREQYLDISGWIVVEVRESCKHQKIETYVKVSQHSSPDP